METAPPAPPVPPATPWQPITFGGVAAFSRARWGRLLVVQALTSLAVGVSVACFLVAAWFPLVQKAISRLPDKGAIRGGQLEWNGPSPVWLAEGTFLSILVDPGGGSSTGHIADVQLVLERNRMRICSLFGCLTVAYPREWTFGLNRAEAEPWLGAWRPFLVPGVVLAVAVGLLAAWTVLATVYMVPLRLITFYTDRQAGLGACWRIAGAAQLPGALLMAGAIVLYGFNRLNLVGLLFAWLLHLAAGWIYLGIAPARLPRLGGAPSRRGNPFGTSPKNRPSPFRK